MFDNLRLPCLVASADAEKVDLGSVAEVETAGSPEVDLGRVDAELGMGGAGLCPIILNFLRMKNMYLY
jgi:hypothetical protein